MTAARHFIAAAMLCVAAALPGGAGAQPLGKYDFGARTDNKDGTAAVTFGRRFESPFETRIETRVGLDWTLAREANLWELPVRLVPVATGSPDSGAAWANVTLPGWGWDKTVVEARVHPFQDQGRLGARASRRVPFGRDVAVTVESGYAVIQKFRHGSMEPAAAPTFEGSHRLGLNYRPTATTISVWQTYSSAENKWLSAVGAEQKLFGGPVSLNASICETADGSLSQAVSAVLRRRF